MRPDGLAELLPPLPDRIVVGDDVEMFDLPGTPAGFKLHLGEVVDVIEIAGVRCAAVLNPSGNTYLAARLDRCRRRPA